MSKFIRRRNMLIFFAVVGICVTVWSIRAQQNNLSRIFSSHYPPDRLSEEEKKFYGAVYVLQKISTLAAENAIIIPMAALRDDLAMSLSAHHDPHFVLNSVGEMLEDQQVRLRFPEARYYAALAWWEVGEYARVVTNITEYMQQRPNQHTSYALLTESYFRLNQYGFCLEKLLQWEQLAPDCDAPRLLLHWGTLFNMGLYEEALLITDIAYSCELWQAPALQAKTLLGMGRQDAAQALIQKSLLDNPEKAAQLRSLWTRLLSTELYTL